MHSHGTEDGPGLSCPEVRVGSCLLARAVVELARAWGVDEQTARLRLTGRP